ncbi:nitronate monooxygenase family protein [Janthinobacterium sp. PC23-8]|uniref:NAD(P)H-dependent flavin oxidoreductase n=1 Tax=Janthinobacterium sp. PC23-8 TaxID=2012679 RepID=UPI000B966628|nr:nitronate monooxygenase [Janthinobacterium sp. PC23-8]OYO29929.1 2-nitropropane dioxygenase [Janthinobacterium sp. PC23-8]
MTNNSPDQRVTRLLGVDLPVIQAPMVAAAMHEVVVAVAQAGGLGSLACAGLDAQQIRAEMQVIRAATDRPVNLNFFCHQQPEADAAREAAWRDRLHPYYVELGIDPALPIPTSVRRPFGEEMCALVEELRPGVVSFHFGLPSQDFLARVKATGAVILSSATTVAEALWLEQHGCDAIIAQGWEAGGHRGMFLTDDIDAQVGTFALVPQMADAVTVPVIAAGGIADARGVRAALALGASAVQVGTAYLLCPEARTSAIHRAALAAAHDDQTRLTNVFTGRPARGLANRLVREAGPMSALAPAFPLAGGASLLLKQQAEAQGSGDFSLLWSGQAARLAASLPAGSLTLQLAAAAGFVV